MLVGWQTTIRWESCAQLVGSKKLFVENRVQLVGSNQLFVGNRVQLVGSNQIFVENRVQLVGWLTTICRESCATSWFQPTIC